MNRIQNLVERIQNYFRQPRNAITASVIVILLIAGFLIKTPPPHISLVAEPLLEGGSSWLTNSMLTTILVDIVILILALWTRANLKMIPSGFSHVVEIMLEALYNLTQSVAGKRAPDFFPWAATIFILVLVSNYSGLIPGVGSILVTQEAGGHAAATESSAQPRILGGELVMANGAVISVNGVRSEAQQEEEHAASVPLFRAPSADLNMTLALGLATMVMAQIWGIRQLGFNYFKKFFQFKRSGMGIIMGLAGLLELVSEFTKIISFTFRLFGNIFAGEVLLLVMSFLFAFLLPMPFYALEIFVGFIQSLVFMMLAVVFFTVATLSHGDGH